MSTNGLLGIEVRHLTALDAIAVHGTFSAAALALGYTQSAVSQQIATLERRLGERLIERGGGSRRVELTEAGRLVRRHAGAIVAHMDAVRVDLCAMREARQGIVRLGVFQSVGARLLPSMHVRLDESWPGIVVELREQQECEGLEGGVVDGKLDLAFTLGPLPDELPLTSELAFDDDHLFVSAVDQAPPGSGCVALADLPLDRLVGFRDCRGQRILEAFLADEDRDAHFVARTDDNGLMQGLVAAGKGQALIPRLAFDANDTRVVAREVVDVPPRRIHLVRSSDRPISPAMQAVVDAARVVCADLVAA